MTCRKCTASLPNNAVFCHLCGTKQEIPKQRTRARPNGTGTAYKRGQTWTAAVVIGWKAEQTEDGLKKRLPVWRTKGGFKTKREALEHCQVLREEVSKPTYALPLSHYWDLYSENGMLKLAESTQQAYKIAYDKLTEFHGIPVDALTVKLMQDKLNEATPTFNTAKDARSLLSNLFQLAVYNGDVTINRAQALVLPEDNSEERMAFTIKELTALWKHYTDGNVFTGFLLLMTYTGMMPVEVRRLDKKHIDWNNKIITGIGAKTGKRKDTPIVLADVILPVLADLCDAATTDKLMTLSEGAFYRAFYAVLRAIGAREGLTPYSCRHTTATALEVHAKATPGVIAEVMRQKTVKMQRTYIHPETINALEAVNRMPSG